LVSRLVKVLVCVVRRGEGRPVEVVEHQVHVFRLLVLQVVSDLDVSVHLNFNVSICLPRQGSRLCEPALVNELLV